MNEDHEKLLGRIKEAFLEQVEVKYREGNAAHEKDDLFRISVLGLIEEGMKEAIDQYVYLFTAREKVMSEFIGRIASDYDKDSTEGKSGV